MSGINGGVHCSIHRMVVEVTLYTETWTNMAAVSRWHFEVHYFDRKYLYFGLNLSLRIGLTLSHHSLWQWLGACLAPSHYLSQWWYGLLVHHQEIMGLMAKVALINTFGLWGLEYLCQVCKHAKIELIPNWVTKKGKLGQYAWYILENLVAQCITVH